MLTFNETDQAVADFLKEIRVKYQPAFISHNDNDKEWKHDLFNIVFVSGSNSIVTPFKTGIGHRVKRVGYLQKVSNVEAEALRKIRATITPEPNRLPIVNDTPYPTSASVLYSLLLDANCVEETFPNFCANFGYDEDSRKALDIYLQCQAISNTLHKVFSSKELEQLEELLQDY